MQRRERKKLQRDELICLLRPRSCSILWGQLRLLVDTGASWVPVIPIWISVGAPNTVFFRIQFEVSWQHESLPRLVQ